MTNVDKYRKLYQGKYYRSKSDPECSIYKMGGIIFIQSESPIVRILFGGYSLPYTLNDVIESFECGRWIITNYVRIK